MPRSVPSAELDAVVEVVRRAPDGISIDGIHHALKSDISRRTLQRRLSALVEQNRLTASGRGRGCRYYPPVGANRRPTRDEPLSRQHALAVLARLKPVLQNRFGVTRLALFGSTAKGHARPGSDIDIIVAFDGPATSKRYFGVQFMLEDALGRDVDLVTEKALRPELKSVIEHEAVNV